MKLKKIISSLLVAAMAMSMSVSAFATEYLYFGQAEYVEGENITVNLYLHEDVKKIQGGNMLGITYSAEAFKFVSGSTIVSTATVAEGEDGVVTFVDGAFDEIEITDTTTPFMTMVFEVEEPTKVADVPFEIISDGMGDRTMFGIFVGEGLENIFIMTEDEKQYLGSMTVAVEEPAPADPVPGTVGEKDGYVTVVDDNKATRFVVTDTKTSVAATAASVLKATYAGETKQANLYKLLGVENAEELGNVTIGSLTVKMVLPATVQDAASIGAYSFVIE